MRKLMGAAVVACIVVSRGSAHAQLPTRVPQVATRTRDGLTEAQLEAQRECRNAIDTRPGYQVRRVGTPVRHGTRQWDVPVTVRRDGSEIMRVTCRCNGANGKVTLRQR